MNIDPDELMEEEKKKPTKPEGAPEKTQEVKQEPQHPSSFKKEHADLNSGDWFMRYPGEIVAHANKHGFFIAPSLVAAMEQRAEEKKAMTIREADIAYRKKFNLSSPMFLATFIGIRECPFMYEDDVGGKTSIYELRNIYNQKLKLVSTGTAEDIEKIRKQMKKILFALDGAGYPAILKETEEGFHNDLCKPEFTSWDQYYDKLKNDPSPSIHNWEEILKNYEQHNN